MIVTKGDGIYDGESLVAIANHEIPGPTLFWDKATFRFVDPYKFSNPSHRSLINKELRERRELLGKQGIMNSDWVV